MSHPWAKLITSVLLCLLVAHVPARPPDATTVELNTIRDRYIRSVLPTDPEEIERIHARAAAVANDLREDGSWSDIRYDGNGTASWANIEHLSRTLLMAKSAKLKRLAQAPDQALDTKTLAALRYWTDRDFQNPNWWWNQIGVPTLIGEIACLMVDVAPRERIDAVVAIMSHSKLETATGANLVWGAIVQIVRGCLEESAPTVQSAYARLYREIRIVAPDEEGIQADQSFHQHGPQSYSGGYGLAYANDVGRFMAYAHGTSLQASPEQLQTFSAYLLDGEQRMIRGNVFDYSALGREITRKGKVAVPSDWSNGPIAPTGPAYGLGNVVALLAEMPSPRQGELTAFRDRLLGAAGASELIGNRHFWCSDYMAHRREGYLASVRMFSTRTLNTEKVNNEGKQSAHLADGANFLYLTGDEYKDLFPVWDWNKVPGTTAEVLDDTNAIEPKAVGTFGKTAFVGGVSDGVYGLCAMDLQRGHLSAERAWFFFDDAYVCLGAGITCEADQPVVTSVNQTHLVGEISSDRIASIPRGEHDLAGAKWIYHNNVAYVFGPQDHVLLGNDVQQGKWSDIGAGSDELVTLPVFNLWIDHGGKAANATYAYTVLPGVSRGQIEAKSASIQMLRNDAQMQAVFSESAGVLGVVFRTAGTIKTPIGAVTVDHACLLLVRKAEKGIAVWASNPLNQAMDLEVQIDSQHFAANLPEGSLAGSSVKCRN